MSNEKTIKKNVQFFYLQQNIETQQNLFDNNLPFKDEFYNYLFENTQDHTNQEFLITNDVYIEFQDIKRNENYIFGKIYKSSPMKKQPLQKINILDDDNGNTIELDEDALEKYIIKNFSFFVLDFSNKIIVELINANAPTIKKYFTKYLNDLFFSKEYTLIPVKDKHINSKIKRVKKLISTEVVIHDPCLHEKQWLFPKEDFLISQEMPHTAKIELRYKQTPVTKNQLKKIMDKDNLNYINKYEITYLDENGEKEVIELIESLLIRKVAVDFTSDDLNCNTDKNHLKIKEALITELIKLPCDYL